MKKIVALLGKETNNEMIVNTAIQMAKLFRLEINVYHFVAAPFNWESLGRTARDSKPKSKLEMNEARLEMDRQLMIIRSENIAARKTYLLYDSDQPKVNPVDNTQSLVITDKVMFERRPKAEVDFLCDFAPVKLIVGAEFEPKEIGDIVLSSDFHTFSSQSVSLLDTFIENLDFNLNLVFINTDKIRENSEISIENMKKTIAENGFRKTSISIFNAKCRISGVESFANIKGGDLIITEERSEVDMTQLKDKHLPIIIVKK